ncbi:hypothetical protein BH11PAT2_BH11PAT2_04770 [soil metagenome]
MEANTLLEAALGYLDDCRTVIPLNGKKPVIPSWKEYQDGKAPTAEEMTTWFNTYGDQITGLGMVTGYVHGLAVLDLENDEDPTRFEIPPTAVSRTGSGGWHYFFDFPKDTDFVKSGSLIPSGIHGDMKADGGYVVVPPSIHPTTGNAYEWIVPLTLETELPSMPEWLVKIEDDRKKNDIEATDWKEVLNGAKEGSRHETAVRLAGKLVHHLPGKDWNDVARPLLHAWNQGFNQPPLPDKEIDSVFRGIAQKQKGQGDEGTTYESKENVPQATPRTLLTLSAIMTMPESERPEYLVYGLIPEKGITAVSGHPGSGKSWFMLHLAKCVASGEAFLGRFKTKSGKVLIIDEEQGAWEQRRRMELLGCAPELPVYFYCLDGFKLDKKEDMDALLKTVKENDISLVMLDPFVAIHSQDENSAEGAQKVMEALQRFNLAGATVLFIHHHRKSTFGSTGGAQSLRGSSAYSGRLDSHITVDKKSTTPSEQHLDIEHVKSRRGQNVEKFQVVLTQEGDAPDSPISLRYADAEDRITKKDEARTLIIAFLASNGDATKEEITKAVQDEAEIGTRNIAEALSVMTKDESLTISKEGKKNKYHLEEKALTETDDEPPY